MDKLYFSTCPFLSLYPCSDFCAIIVILVKYVPTDAQKHLSLQPPTPFWKNRSSKGQSHISCFLHRFLLFQKNETVIICKGGNSEFEIYTYTVNNFIPQMGSHPIQDSQNNLLNCELHVSIHPHPLTKCEGISLRNHWQELVSVAYTRSTIFSWNDFFKGSLDSLRIVDSNAASG